MDNSIRNDFPIDWNDDEYVSRRDFFKFLTVSSGGLAMASIGMAAWSKLPRHRRSFEPKPIHGADALAVGAWMQFEYPRPGDTCILVRTAPETYAAFSRRCTHLSCPVIWQPGEHRLYCPCHEGAFSIRDGRVLQGPPARPLPQIELELHDGDLFAVGVRNGEA